MLKLSELLTGREVLTLSPSGTAREAAQAMNDHHVGAVLVADGEGRPQGIFTERDLMKRVIVPGREPSDVRLEEVLTRELHTASVDQLVTTAAQEMQDRHIRHLPVVDGQGQVVGLLSLRDLLRELLRQKMVEVRALTDYIQGPGE